jgi:acyl phosphate:glycerol-3-phosphate acyltransferase
MGPKMILLAIFSYVLGGIPSGYLIARLVKKIDIREHGSGNPGAANVYRTIGRWAGWSTLVLDATKGFIPVSLSLHYFPGNIWLAIICGALAIIGHMWTIFLKFKGGKGVATSAGVFGAMLPFPTLIAFSIFAILTGTTKHISIGSMSAALALPIVSFAMKEYPPAFSVMVSLVSALIIYRHIPNIKRLMKKKELYLEDGSKKTFDKKF